MVLSYCVPRWVDVVIKWMNVYETMVTDQGRALGTEWHNVDVTKFLRQTNQSISGGNLCCDASPHYSISLRERRTRRWFTKVWGFRQSLCVILQWIAVQDERQFSMVNGDPCCSATEFQIEIIGRLFKITIGSL